MRTILRFLVSLFEAFLRALLRAPRQTAEDASSQHELRARLQSKIRKTWKRSMLWPPLLLVMLPACTTRTVYVPDGTPVRLRETVRNVKVWVIDESGEPVPGEMDLPEGWYCLASE
jgi:hypothetical protein